MVSIQEVITVSFPNLPMFQIVGIDMVSILLLSPGGLAQISLSTAIAAVPLATIIGKAFETTSALSLINNLKPDVLFVNATIFQDQSSQFLNYVKSEYPQVISVILTTASLQRSHFLAEGADFVLDDKNLNLELTQILKQIQSQRKMI